SFTTHVAPTRDSYTLSLHDALPIYELRPRDAPRDRDLPRGRELLATPCPPARGKPALDAPRLLPARLPRVHRRVAYLAAAGAGRSEEHTSELQSRFDLVCRLLLEKK